AGRMGAELLRIVREDRDARFVAGTVRTHGPARELSSRLAVPVDDTLEAALARGADVVVDFTSPEATVSHARICTAKGTPLVVGTTGLSPDDRGAIEEAAARIPIVLSPNMSVGMNLLFRVVAEAGSALSDFDAEIVEIHHRHKKDAPSGSALRLARSIAEGRGDGSSGELVHGRHGQTGERQAGPIGMHALRGGDVAGDHTVFFLGPGERLELTHRASSRAAFAAGAVRAARWVAGKAPGLYSMQDVLGT
ncbi:MAG TPA: 4-hydroxy-tetrahydrodipicolinate reductase, partial [Vulgatibacter sp.]